MSSTNPYQPPAEQISTTVLSAKRIDFEGSVSIDDIAALLGRPLALFALRAVSVVFIATLLFFVVAMFRLSEPGNFRGGLVATLAFVAVFVLILYALDRMAGAAFGAKRLVKRHPELIGPQLGYIDSFGLTFFHEPSGQYLQFSWSAFQTVKVSDAGLRFQWEDAEHFFAVPSRCIDGFKKQQLQQIISVHRAKSNQPAVYQCMPDWKDAPSDAIRFQNYLPLKLPASRMKIALTWSMTIATYAIGIAVAVMIYNEVHAVATAMVGAVAIAVSILQAKWWKQVSPDPYYVRQWGWITEHTIHARHPYAAHDFRWEETSGVSIRQDRIHITLLDGDSFGLISDSPMSEKPNEDWQRLSRWAKAAQQSETEPK